jgi:hypothetical protein
MRDPNRIDEILKLIAIYWKKYPDTRLGQLIWNLSYSQSSDVFYIEDDFLKTALMYALLRDGPLE